MKILKSVIIFILIAFSVQLFAAQANQASTNSNTRQPRTPTAQDRILTQPQETRENELFRESMREIERNQNRFRVPLPTDRNDFDQYGVKKQMYFKFHAGFGYGLIDGITGAPRNYDWDAHSSANGYPHGSKNTRLVYDFSFMAVFKPSRKRHTSDAFGYGIEVGYTSITIMKGPYNNFWGIPINFVFQVPLYKMFKRSEDVLFIFGLGVFLPARKNILSEDQKYVQLCFTFTAELNFPLTKDILIPVFFKTRFIFLKKLYWLVELGTGISF